MKNNMNTTATKINAQLETIYAQIQEHQNNISKGENKFYNTQRIESLSKLAAKREEMLKNA